LTAKLPFDLKDELMAQGRLWDRFTRKVEYGSINQDRHGRYIPDKAELQDITIPAISQHLLDRDFNPEYPDDKRFAICLTHDVDDVCPPITHSLLSIPYHLMQRDYCNLKKTLLWKIDGKQKSPYRNFRDIIKIEQSFDAKSTFFFLATDRDIRRFRYNIEDLEEELALITDAGWDMGLHGSYYAYDSLDELCSEKKRLEVAAGRKITGYRGHYLRFKVPHTWELLKAAGFCYDSTLGYGSYPGFRNQMCHPFYPYNLYENRPIGIMEISLNLADMALFGKRGDIAWDTVKKLVDVVEENQGVLTVLWHNYIFGSPFRKTSQKIYRMLLDYGRNRNAWMTSAEEIWSWLDNDL
jgi:peptidoglycan/xylan/chitin deacetylase (PgdA/CDA1 family)